MIYFFSVFLLVMPVFFFYFLFRITHLIYPVSPIILGLISFLLASAYPLSNLFNRTYHGLLGKTLVTISGVILGILTIGLGVLFIFEIFNLLNKLLKFPVNKLYIGFFLIGVIIILTTYALVNALHPVLRIVKIPVQGLTENKRIVYMSDLHIDSIHEINYLKEVVDKVNVIDADFVIINGDFIDSTVFDTGSFQHLNNINKSVFFTFGNHEKYVGNQFVRDLLDPTKVRMLENEVIEYNGLQIIGIQDLQGFDNKPNQDKLDAILSQLQINPTLPTVMSLHEPIGPQISKKYGIDLQLAGHTHNGQIFPFMFLVKIAFPYIKGLYDLDGMHLFVSVGAGTWGPPMRLGSKSEIVVLELIGK